MKTRVQASSLIEVLVAMTILLVVFGIALTVIENLQQRESKIFEYVELNTIEGLNVETIKENKITGLPNCKTIEIVYRDEQGDRYSSFKIECDED